MMLPTFDNGRGDVGVVLLVLLIVLAIFLSLIVIATCYLYNLCNCYQRIHSRSPHKINYNEYMRLKTKENKVQPPKNSIMPVYGYSSAYEHKTKPRKPSKLPVIGTTDEKLTMSIRVPRPNSTVLSGLGRITFSLKYTEETQRLHVNLICGRQISLRNGEFARMSVVKVNINGKIENERHSSPDDTPNPEFDEVLSFPLSGDLLGESVLYLVVWDADPNLFKTLIGFIRVPLGNFIDSLLKPAGTGPITREINENSENDIPCRTNGEILFSLSYTAEQDKLVVAILKCRGLETKDDVTALYVVVSLCIEDKEITSRTTPSIEKFRDDVFNEIITFEPCIRQDGATRDNISLKIVLYSESLSGQKEAIGRALVGPKTTDEGVSHWKEMTNSSRTAVAQWHRLVF